MNELTMMMKHHSMRTAMVMGSMELANLESLMWPICFLLSMITALLPMML